MVFMAAILGRTCFHHFWSPKQQKSEKSIFFIFLPSYNLWLSLYKNEKLMIILYCDGLMLINICFPGVSTAMMPMMGSRPPPPEGSRPPPGQSPPPREGGMDRPPLGNTFCDQFMFHFANQIKDDFGSSVFSQKNIVCTQNSVEDEKHVLSISPFPDDQKGP